MSGAAGAAKARVRARVRDARAARGIAARDLAADEIARRSRDLVPAGPAVVAAYVSMPHEPGTGPLLEQLFGAGHRVLVPRVSGGRLEWAAWSPGSSLQRGAFGIDEPTGPARAGGLAGADVVFVPALSVDRAGFRLGQGGGFYDRALADVAARASGGPLRVACVFDEEVVDEVPHEPHDIRVDAALTPSGVVALG